MLEDFATADSDYYSVSDVSNITKEVTTVLPGLSAALEFDKGTAGTTATVMRYLGAPLDLTVLHTYQPDIEFWHRVVDYTSPGITKVELLLASDLGVGGTTLTTVAAYGDTGSFTDDDWNRHTQALFSPDGGLDIQAMRKVIGLGFRVTTAGSTAITDMFIGAVVIRSTSLLKFNGHRLVVPRFSDHAENWDDVAVVKESEQKAERRYESSRKRITAGWQSLNLAQYPVLVDGLKKFDRYAQGANDWSLGLEAGQEIDTTLDAASGTSESDPRKLNLTSTGLLEFALTHLGLTDVRLLVGPNSSGQSEVVTIPSSSYVSSGAYAIAEERLAFDYASGDPVRSLGYHPACVLLGGSTVTQAGDSEGFSLEATAAGL